MCVYVVCVVHVCVCSMCGLCEHLEESEPMGKYIRIYLCVWCMCVYVVCVVCVCVGGVCGVYVCVGVCGCGWVWVWVWVGVSVRSACACVQPPIPNRTVANKFRESSKFKGLEQS